MGRDTLQQNATLPPELSPAQDKALAAILGGATVTAAAKSACVDLSTVHRWLADPEFVAALNTCRHEMYAALRQGLRVLAAEAIVSMRNILADRRTPAAARVRAASEVLRMALAEKCEAPTEPAGAATVIQRRRLDAALGRGSTPY
jgi:hypothetical protein